jgi:hypothetical protein
LNFNQSCEFKNDLFNRIYLFFLDIFINMNKYISFKITFEKIRKIQDFFLIITKTKLLKYGLNK